VNWGPEGTTSFRLRGIFEELVKEILKRESRAKNGSSYLTDRAESALTSYGD
jgi:hypothetical protein